MMGPPREMPSRLSASRIFLVLTRPSGALAHRLVINRDDKNSAILDQSRDDVVKLVHGRRISINYEVG
ncbi:unnamed protein product [Caenorhabditis auriculariae]|uniref:Uncharacterized protein n=1 Tax=Caenorhabditis auriculariae TaxID=2777116 RepID=A0A8S1HJP8_9PELO|nr:unnamed protein product [Caenorhabditis auriculariae]